MTACHSSRILQCCALLAAGGLAAPGAQAAPKKKVACTLATIESLVREVGGDRVDAFSLSAGDQDPHTVSPTPSLMKKVRQADLLLEIGMQLELWADEVANGSGNPRLAAGGAGRIALSTGIPKLEVPATVSRAQGDIHPEGNPHLWLDPARARLLAANIAVALSAASPQDAAHFAGRLADFQRRIDQAMFGAELLKIVGSQKLNRLELDGRLLEFLASNELGGKQLTEAAGGWLAASAPLRGQKVVELHQVWAYAAATFGFRLVGTVEEKPGIPPGPRHLADLIGLVRRDGVRLILVDNFYDPALAQRVAHDGGARAVILPNQVGGEPGVADYFQLIDHVLRAMVAPLGGE